MSTVEILPRRVVIFEDDEAAYNRLETRLRETADRLQCSVVRHEGHRDALSVIMEPSPAMLVVLDWDLSRYNPPVQRELIRGICRERYIPLCTYHQVAGEHDKIRRLLKWNDDEIAVDSLQEHGQIGERCGSILEGFIIIHDAFAEEAQKDLGERVSRILAAPEGVDIQLEQYSWGQQRLVQVIDVDDKSRFVTTAIGYWIFNQLLQFPGLLLNTVAAASYLDVDAEMFQSKQQLRDVFRGALYDGPFKGLGPYYWLPTLDDIRSEHMNQGDTELISGWEVLRRNNLDGDHSRCIHDHEGAGYYCLVTGRPVCHKHSIAPSGWVPIGADRSRIEVERYEELEAWLGI